MPARDFDIHVYYNESSRPQAEALRELALKDFNGRPIHVSRMVDRKVGPHPLPMFEIDFGKEDLGEMIQWLFKNRNGLTVLVHQVTGHDTIDHSAGALWMGEVLEIDFSTFDN